jgi:hypothetical protein
MTLQGRFHLDDGYEPPAPMSSPRNYCKCYRRSWEVTPAGGYCRSCGAELRDWDVRRLHAIALEEHARISAKLADWEGRE